MWFVKLLNSISLIPNKYVSKLKLSGNVKDLFVLIFRYNYVRTKCLRINNLLVLILLSSQYFIYILIFVNNTKFYMISNIIINVLCEVYM